MNINCKLLSVCLSVVQAEQVYNLNLNVIYKQFKGKTTFIENLISSNRVDRKWKTIYYVYPFELGEPSVSWDTIFGDINVQYITELPDIRFFDTAERHSLIVIDDLWVESCDSPDIVKCFKVNI